MAEVPPGANPHLWKVGQSSNEVAASVVTRNLAIIRARETGLTYEDIARAAGLTRQRVHAICKEAQNGN